MIVNFEVEYYIIWNCIALIILFLSAYWNTLIIILHIVTPKNLRVVKPPFCNNDTFQNPWPRGGGKEIWRIVIVIVIEIYGLWSPHASPLVNRALVRQGEGIYNKMCDSLDSTLLCILTCIWVKYHHYNNCTIVFEWNVILWLLVLVAQSPGHSFESYIVFRVGRIVIVEKWFLK